MPNGGLLFGELRPRPRWNDLRDHVAKLTGATLTGFVGERSSEIWLEFEYAGYAFTVSDQFTSCWFIVADGTCPDPVLLTVLDHFSSVAR